MIFLIQHVLLRIELGLDRDEVTEPPLAQGYLLRRTREAVDVLHDLGDL